MRWLTAFLDVSADPAADEAFWRAVTGAGVSTRRGGRGEFASLVPPDGDAYLRLQTLREGPARVHLDLHVDDVTGSAGHAIEHGAVVLDDRAGLVILASPGGLVFCLVQHHGEEQRPPPQIWPEGSRSLVDQVCLDIPSELLDVEAGFWSSLTGWPLSSASASEFQVLTRPAGQPLRLLLQRLDESAVGQPVSAHLDLAADDADAEVARHLTLGARLVHRRGNWVTLVDPAGRQYCVTRRNPDSGLLAH